MSTALCHRLYKCALYGAFILLFAAGSYAQSKLAVAYNPAPSPGNLNSSLTELMRVAPAANQDLAGLPKEGGKLHWIKFWHRDKAHRAQVITALRRNLQFAVPSLVQDARASSGSISATFKLYQDLNAVCESLDSLLPPGSGGSKTETALGNDLADMNRIREQLSSYIQQTAAAFESKHPELLSSAGHLPKKIIIDDNVPDKPVRKRRSPSN